MNNNVILGSWFNGYGNTAVGSKSLYSNQTGYSNTAIGKHALRKNISGYQNTAVGDNSLLENTIGFYNTAVGGFSLQKIQLVKKIQHMAIMHYLTILQVTIILQ